MLMLRRQSGRSIIIDGNIKVKAIFNRGSDYITLAIDAPKHITVNREEVQKKLDAANATN